MDYLKNVKNNSFSSNAFDLAPNINFDENENKQIFLENMSNKIISRVTVTLLNLNHIEML